jgi:hypothetical protein
MIIKWDYLSADEMVEFALYCAEDERSRLLTLATKHCPKDHHDWAEIIEIADDQPPEV